jgi:PAS domain S-box-containing protein
MPTLAISLEILKRNIRTELLLEETRRQAESMEKQAAKLEEQSVEMEAQQHEIKAAEERSRLILEAVGDGIVGLDTNGFITFANPAAPAMLGYAEDEFVGQKMHPLVHHHYPDGREFPREECSMYLASVTGQPMTVDNEVLWRKDSTPIPVEYVTRPFIKNGAIVGSVTIYRDISTRKEAEGRLATAEERSRLILGAVGDGIVGLDTNGIITFANPAAPAMLGYAEDEFVGQKMHALVHHHYPDGREFPREECSMYLTSHEGQALTVDNEVLWHRDGTAIPVEYTTTVIRKDDTIIGTVVVYRDITERKETEEKINAYFNNSSDGLLTLVPEKGFVHANQRAVELYGFDRLEDLLKCGPVDLSPEFQPDGRPSAKGALAEIATAIQSQHPHHFDWLHKRFDGSLISCEVTLVPITLSGKTTLIVGVRDITERKKAEDAIKHANFLNDQALDLTNAGYWHIPINAEDGYYNSSERAATIFGDPPRPDWRYHLMNEWGANVVAGDKDAADATFKNYAAALEGTVPRYDATYAYKRPIDGRVVWIHAMGDVVRDADGKPTDMFGVTVDITAAKLAEDKLREAMQIAEDATKAKSDFLANMSHEIRTPMNAIIGMSHLALQTQLDKKQRNYIEKVKHAGENLLGIINDILDFSKIEAGKLAMEKTDFHLEDVMDNLANLVGMKTEDKGLELLFNCAADVPTSLVGDPLRLGQILINLGNNAVKFTEKGEIVVGVDKVAADDSGVELHFWVKDSGIGMTPEQCGKMFQSFSQADASTTRKYGGTGLGLVISKNLVELMQGRIWVESEAGKGSTFHFTARFGLQENPAPRRMFLAEELLGVRVLVVDDNASAREILSSMARQFGLEVDTAPDGQQALHLIVESEKKELPYDLVLMDWKMPVMDGVETVQHLRDEHLKKIPSIIMVTAYGREEALGSAEQRGVQLGTVLTKPVNPSTLLEAIGEVLGKGIAVETRASERADDHGDVMAQLSGARLLLVEDNDMNQELATELLQQAGIKVVIANHGQEALDILAKDAAFDGVLMDCQMPVMDGYTATREIRRNPAFKDLPIIAMTANAMTGDREKVLEAGMWDHIAKPLNVAEMYATIAKWVKPSGAACGAAPAASQQQPTGGLPTLPGIDVTAGLATTMNNLKLYTRMLIKFRDSQGSFSELFSAARQDSDPTAAERAAHTLKGTAGNIGARGVQAAAGELEQACHEGKKSSKIDGLLAKVLAELEPVVAGLQQVNTAEAAAAKAEPAIPAGELQAALDQLAALLADNDSAAGDLLSELLDKIDGTPQARALKPVVDAINDYDFDEALEKLKTVNV